MMLTVNLRWFRPFPTQELRKCLGRFRAVGVIDRDFAHGSPDCGGILFHEIRSCLYPLNDGPAVICIMGGLGGRDISIDNCITMYKRTLKSKRGASGDEVVSWIGLRE